MHYIPGQAPGLQACGSLTSPTQSAPPFAGAGLVHVRERLWVPAPQVVEQVPHDSQLDHSPSTMSQ